MGGGIRRNVGEVIKSKPVLGGGGGRREHQIAQFLAESVLETIVQRAFRAVVLESAELIARDRGKTTGELVFGRQAIERMKIVAEASIGRQVRAEIGLRLIGSAG